MNALSHINGAAGASPDQLRSAAQQWVGQTFFGTLLKEARATNLGPKDSPLSGGRGEQAFGSMLDQHLSEGASRGVGDKLVDALVNRLGGTVDTVR